MIVLDASTAIELLLGSAAGRRAWDRISTPGVTLHAPHLLDLEVAQVLRRGVRANDLTAERAEAALRTLVELPLERYAHTPLLPRVWQLRDNLTSYDAAYVALAEALDAPLLTGDERLARAVGGAIEIDLLA